jgi:hypothetical protein
MQALWLIRNHHREILVRFDLANGKPVWRDDNGSFQFLQFTTTDLGAVAIHALARAECDTFTIERIS